MPEPLEGRVEAIPSRNAEELRALGWTLIEEVGDAGRCEALLAELGPLRAQYGGSLRHGVRFEPGFDELQYSKSSNGITPHTEAPGEDPPPRYLALHCHRQARCGGGHTVLADGYGFLDSLPPDLLREASQRLIRFDLAGDSEASAAPLWTTDRQGARLLRFSYNVMRDGRFEGPARDHDDLEGVEPFFAELCRRGVEFSRRHGRAVLVPERGLLVFDNWRMLHSRGSYRDRARHLTRYWVG